MKRATSSPTLEQPNRLQNLQQIDTDIGQLRSGRAFSDASYRHELLNSISETILAQYGYEYLGVNPIEQIFSRSTQRELRRFGALCLLRAIGANSIVVSDTVEGRIGPRILDLITETLPDLLKLEKIDPALQNYQKCDLFVTMITDIEEKCRTIVESLAAINHLSQFRQKYFQHINRYRVVFLPFLPHDKEMGWLETIFSAGIDYAETSGPQLLQVYDRVIRTLDGYRLEAERFPTVYTRLYVLPIINQIIALITESFEQSPMSKPANLIIRGSEKKHPLHNAKVENKFGFNILNEGPGHAFDVHIEILDCENLELSARGSNEIFLGSLKPGLVIVDVPFLVTASCTKAAALICVKWVNYDKGSKQNECIVEFLAQRPDVPWAQLRLEQPYSLEPIATEKELVGRAEVLDQLAALVSSRSVGSSFVYGQKRVGKTSVVKALSSRLTSLYPSNFQVVYVEGGDYIHPSPLSTLAALGERLCKQMISADRRLGHIKIPSFDGALSPIVDFLADVQAAIPGYRILFILDEFDELPLDLYRRGEIGDAFFLTLRSISGKLFYGFVLVGGEKMEYLLNSQGVALNKFKPIRIDYFDKEHWQDYQDLIQKPVAPYIEFSDAAITTLFEETAGNPYFTKLICQNLFTQLLQRRDCHVTSAEVKNIVSTTIHNVKTNSFQHFWEDGIFEVGVKKEKISIDRRRVLLSFTDAHRQFWAPNVKQIAGYSEKYGITDDLIDMLRDFVRRQVFDEEAGHYRCHVPFFASWLREVGIREIIITFSSQDEHLTRKKREEENYIQPSEITALARTRWGVYKGRSITEDQVRAWLAQFGDSTGQRLMFKLLQHVRFYRGDTIREKLKEAHGIIKRGTTWRVEQGKRKREDILISYLGGAGKSGVQIAKLYADENSIYFGNIIEEIRLRAVLEQDDVPPVLVFLDDFIGTGDSASSYLIRLMKDIGVTISRREIRVVFVAICGFAKAKETIEKAAQESGFSLEVHICDTLDDSTKCFSPDAGIFSNDTERLSAKKIASEHGVLLVKNAPLGYGDCEAAIVFENSCPNNCLPILWAESGAWIPLFRRI